MWETQMQWGVMSIADLFYFSEVEMVEFTQSLEKFSNSSDQVVHMLNTCCFHPETQLYEMLVR